MPRRSKGTKLLAWIALVILVAFSLLTYLTPTANGPTNDEEDTTSSVTESEE